MLTLNIINVLWLLYHQYECFYFICLSRPNAKHWRMPNIEHIAYVYIYCSVLFNVLMRLLIVGIHNASWTPCGTIIVRIINANSVNDSSTPDTMEWIYDATRRKEGREKEKSEKRKQMIKNVYFTPLGELKRRKNQKFDRTALILSLPILCSEYGWSVIVCWRVALFRRHTEPRKKRRRWSQKPKWRALCNELIFVLICLLVYYEYGSMECWKFIDSTAECPIKWFRSACNKYTADKYQCDYMLCFPYNLL